MVYTPIHVYIYNMNIWTDVYIPYIQQSWIRIYRRNTMYIMYIYIYIPGTQMTLVLIGKDLVLKGSTTKIEDKQVPGIFVNHYTSQFFGSKIGAAPTHPWTRKLSFRTPTCLPPRSFKRMPSGRLHNPWWLKPPPAPSFLPLRCINFWKNEEWRLWRVCIYTLTPIGESSHWDKNIEKLYILLEKSSIFEGLAFAYRPSLIRPIK